uniref:Uncharacterized protein n=1 Tax=Phasianus colchicus TaxID=9054 RepID=A0A669QL14_PHACC
DGLNAWSALLCQAAVSPKSPQRCPRILDASTEGSWLSLAVFFFFFQFGIKSLERGSVRSHQDFSRKTLTALVTSGLLLAALGTAGYFLMRRRSWSPAGQRLVSAYRWQTSHHFAMRNQRMHNAVPTLCSPLLLAAISAHSPGSPGPAEHQRIYCIPMGPAASLWKLMHYGHME